MKKHLWIILALTALLALALACTNDSTPQPAAVQTDAPAQTEKPVEPTVTIDIAPEDRNAETYRNADALEAEGKDAEALAAFASLGDYEDAAARAEAIRTRINFAAAEAVFTGTNYDEGIAALRALGTEAGDAAADALEAEKADYLVRYRADLLALADGRISAGAWHTAAIGSTPWIAGDARYGEAPQEADAVISGLTSVLYLKDGKVLTTGETFGEESVIASLTDITDAAAGLSHALFLHADGTVTGVGSKAYGRTDTSEWTDVADVAAGAWHSVALKADGTVVAIGLNEYGQCDVSGWTDAVSVSAGLWHTVALKADGTVVACGDNTYGQCDVSGWTDVIAIDCGACHTVGLKADGTVVACGDNAAGQCDVSGWTDAAAVAAGAYHTVAVRLDGKLISTGNTPVPDEPLFESTWETEPVVIAASNGAVTEYIENPDSKTGPWLYMDENGAALICIDDSEARTPFRADLFARAGKLPSGRVTNPEASGDYIKMDTELPQTQAQKHHAVVAFTGDYIGYTSNRKAVMIRNGVVYYDRAETTTMAVMPDGTLQLFEKGETNAETLLALGVKDSFSFGPVLAQDGVRVTDLVNEYTMRVAFGYTDPYHYVVAVAMRDRSQQMSHKMIAQVCANYGCRLAYNLDGGHSASLVFLGKDLSLVSLESDYDHLSTIRGLSDVVVFLENDAVQVPD